jgi:hypothetical protein
MKEQGAPKGTPCHLQILKGQGISQVAISWGAEPPVTTVSGNIAPGLGRIDPEMDFFLPGDFGAPAEQSRHDRLFYCSITSFSFFAASSSILAS